jgi:deoxycytidine triphosphate deaminase
MHSFCSLQELLQVGELDWSGSLRGDALLVRLGAPLQPFVADNTALVDLESQPSIDRLYGPAVAAWETHELLPGRLVLCQSLERIRLGTSLGGRISTLSHLARTGLMAHLASSAIMPAFEGYLTLELFNAGPARLLLHQGMPAAKILIENVVGPHRFQASATRFYGHDSRLTSRYADEFGGEEDE